MPYASSDTEQQAEQVSANILSLPGGPWLVGAFGVGFLLFGAGQILSAFRPNFGKQFESYRLGPRQAAWVLRLGRYGITGRGIVFLFIGVLVLYAAINLDPEAVGGMDAAMRLLAEQAYGAWILAVVALGLVAYGLYLVLGALLFRIRPY